MKHLILIPILLLTLGGCAAQYDTRVLGLMHAGYTPLYGPGEGRPALYKFEGNVEYFLWYGDDTERWPSWRATITVAGPHPPHCITYDTLITAINAREILLKVEAWKARYGIVKEVSIKSWRKQ